MSEPLTITSACPTTQPKLRKSFSYTFDVEGGTPPYLWSIIRGALPPGLTLDRDTGTISGIAVEEGTYDYTLLVRDASDVFKVIAPLGTGVWDDVGSAGSPYFFISAAPDGVNSDDSPGDTITAEEE